METQLRALLTGSAAVTALAPAARINWGAHPQGKPLPYIVLAVVSEVPQHTLGGTVNLRQNRVQVDCYADSYAAAHGLAAAVIGALDGYRGGQFQGVFHAGTRDSREGGTNEADRPYRRSLDFTTHWSES